MSGPAAWPDVGRGLARTRVATAVSVVVAAAVVARDLWAAGSNEPWTWRLLPPAVALGLFAVIARGRAADLGLRLRPAPSFGWWLRAGVAIGVALALLILAGTWIFHAVVGEVRVPRPFASREDVLRWTLHACLVAPLVEEAVYRAVLCTALAPCLGRWPTIAVSGVAFAALHHVYGNPGLDNQVAGFVLAWAYLRSGALWLPVVLHAAGNLGVGLFHLAVLEGWVRLPSWMTFV